jgi:uncharacterized protein (DUF736 family)
MTTQIQCGHLQAKKSKDGQGTEFQGTVRLIGRLNGTIVLMLHPNAANATNENHPDYEVFYQPAGETHAFPVGAAWLKEGERVGEFLSITMAHPDWADDLNLSAFPPNTQRSETAWRVVWSRPRGARVQDQPAQAAA